MIRLSKLNKSSFVLNCELIEMMESTPDTVITMSSGKKHVVTESIEEVVAKVVQYKGSIFGFKSDISTWFLNQELYWFLKVYNIIIWIFSANVFYLLDF